MSVEARAEMGQSPCQDGARIQLHRLEIDILTIEAPDAVGIIMGWNQFNLFSTLGIA